MNTKAKGSRVERELKKKLESMDYNVSKSGGSLGLFDLIATNVNHILLIQVKSNRISNQEKSRIALFKNHPLNCYKIIAIKKDYKPWEVKIVEQFNEEIKEFIPVWLGGI